MLTTTEAAALLRERGIPQSGSNLRRHCRLGHVPGAVEYGGRWLIPRETIATWTPPRRGRPPVAPPSRNEQQGGSDA